MPKEPPPDEAIPDITQPPVEQAETAIEIVSLPSKPLPADPQVASQQTVPPPQKQPTNSQLAPANSIAPAPGLSESTPPISNLSPTPAPTPPPNHPPASPPSDPPPGDPPPGDSPTEPPGNSGPEAGFLVQLGDDFPHLQGAESGCYGLENCHRINNGESYRKAATALADRLRAENYQVTERDDIDNTGRRVFEIIPPNEPEKTYYLNVFSDSSGSTVYAITVEILTLIELQQLNE